MLKSEIPEIEDYVRILHAREIVHAGTESRSEQLTFADPSLFDVFSFPLQSRIADDVLGQPNTVVLTATTAFKSFQKSEMEGRPFEESAPCLTAYLGHETFFSTEKYLTTDYTMYTDSQQKVAAAIEHLFPEVSFE